MNDSTLQAKSVPQHIAIIMDGNGRWAKAQGLSRLKGHSRGTEVAQTIIEEASNRGIKYLSLFAFSTENWGRPQDEVSFLFSLLGKYLSDKGQELIDKNICLKTIGDLSGLPKNLQNRIQNIKSKSEKNSGLQLIFALNYGGRNEITQAALRLAQDFKINASLEKQILDKKFEPKDFESYLETSKVPDPDLVIRTSGEIRLSNFMLWQMAYSELYFCDKYWPDFNVEDFDKALLEYSLRQRRFGSLNKSTSPESTKSPSENTDLITTTKPESF